jgi:Arylsulfotransferase (ASST)
MRTDRLAKSLLSKRRLPSIRTRKLTSEMLESRMLLAQTTGLFLNDPGTAEGYVLFSPNTANTTYLMDKDANIVHQWTATTTPGLNAYLLPDGSIMRSAALHSNSNNGAITAAGGGGRLERINWQGVKTWEFTYDSAGPTTADVHWAHHDIEIMPNGNILMIAWELKTEAEATAAGRDEALPGPGFLYPDHIIEVKPDYQNGGGTIVWEWHVWDHLVQDLYPAMANYETSVADHPERIDINYVSTFDVGGGAAEDWNHSNGIEYNPELDQILLSVREFSEFWIIDHSTTTLEAKGHTGGNSGKGGDLLYRWGNPQTYGGGDASDRVLYFQHDARWVEDDPATLGHITVFNNGYGGPANPDVSKVEEIVPPVDEMGNYPSLTPGEAYGPETAFWTYTGPEDKFAAIISGAKRLENGNTLITYGVNGTFSEVTPAGLEVWKYVNPYTGGGVLGPETPIPNLGIAIPGLDSLLVNFVFQAQHYAPEYLDANSAIAGRHIFYNQSKWDGNSAAINVPADNSAIATDKSAYIPGSGLAIFDNVTSYTKGINGIIVDITGSHPGITTADFNFNVGNDNTPASWSAAPAPVSLSVFAGRGVGGSDRVEITWATGAIKSQWLEVQVLATAATGLASTDVHYWGNRPADAGTGSPAGSFETSVLDAATVFSNLAGAATKENLRDYDRDGDVDVLDAAVVFASLGNTVTINAGAAEPFVPAGPAASEIVATLTRINIGTEIISTEESFAPAVAEAVDTDGANAIALALAAAEMGPKASWGPTARIDAPQLLRESVSAPTRSSAQPPNEVTDQRAMAMASTPDWLLDTLDTDDLLPRLTQRPGP